MIAGGRIFLVAVEAAGRQRRDFGREQVDLAIRGERVHVDELNRVLAARRQGDPVGDDDLAGVARQPPRDVEQRLGLVLGRPIGEPRPRPLRSGKTGGAWVAIIAVRGLLVTSPGDVEHEFIPVDSSDSP